MVVVMVWLGHGGVKVGLWLVTGWLSRHFVIGSYDAYQLSHHTWKHGSAWGTIIHSGSMWELDRIPQLGIFHVSFWRTTIQVANNLLNFVD